MTAPTTDPAAPPAPDPANPPAGGTANPPAPANGTRSLADLLTGLDETARAAILGEVSKARNEAHTLRTERNDLRTKAEQWDAEQTAKLTAQEKAEKERDAALARVAAADERVVLATVARLAADKFADVTDATGSVKASEFLKSDGSVDEAKVTTHLDTLLTSKPHWAKTTTAPPRPAPNVLQGTGQQSLAELAAGGDKKAARLVKAQQLHDLARGTTPSA